MTNVRFHPDADEELGQAIDWYVARSASAAAGFVRDVEHALSRISEAPERYPLTRHRRHRFVLLNYPYDLIDRATPREVEIIAVAHHARRPGYWENR